MFCKKIKKGRKLLVRRRKLFSSFGKAVSWSSRFRLPNTGYGNWMENERFCADRLFIARSTGVFTLLAVGVAVIGNGDNDERVCTLCVENFKKKKGKRWERNASGPRSLG